MIIIHLFIYLALCVIDAMKMYKDYYEIHSADYEEALEIFAEEPDESEGYEDYEDYDLECGFNPYEGCYDYDC